MKIVTTTLAAMSILLVACASGVETPVAGNSDVGEACRDSSEAEIAALFEN